MSAKDAGSRRRLFADTTPLRTPDFRRLWLAGIVTVIGGMGSIMGSILSGFGLGLIEGLTKVVYPEASNTVIFVIMAIVLLIKPAGLFGTEK